MRGPGHPPQSVTAPLYPVGSFVHEPAATLVGNDSVSSYTQPSHGSVSFANGVATYTPGLGYSGPDSFTYTVGDGHGGSDTATVTLTVTSPPPPPPPPPPGAGSVAGMIWDDADGDGVQDVGEAGFGTSVQVLLLDALGSTVASTWTSFGTYSFQNVANGQYRIRVLLPVGYEFSPPNQGDDNTDSDVDADGYSGFFTVSGATLFDLDGGVEDV